MKRLVHQIARMISNVIRNRRKDYLRGILDQDSQTWPTGISSSEARHLIATAGLNQDIEPDLFEYFCQSSIPIPGFEEIRVRFESETMLRLLWKDDQSFRSRLLTGPESEQFADLFESA